ncbi:hypothetical protein ACVWYN_000290 [Pedobacter sp. UYP24]
MKNQIMDIALKYKIVEKIIQSNDDGLLNEIKALIGLSETDFWADVPTDVKLAIHKAKKELDGGEGTPHIQVMSEVKSRFLSK